MLATGIRTPVGIKIFGPELSELERLGKEVEAAVAMVPGTRSAFAERAVSGYYLDIEIDRQAAARYGLNVGDVQAVIATIVSDADGYALKVAAELRRAGLRVETDLRNEKINYKVREHSLAKAPVILVVGKREAEEGKVAMRRLGSNDSKTLTLAEVKALLTDEGEPPDLKKARMGG